MSDLSEALKHLSSLGASDPRDWSVDSQDAVLYAITSGWDPEQPGYEDGAMEEVAARLGWGPDFVAKLRRFRAAYQETESS